MNDKVYIHELIDIIGQNRARYMHHMTANWVPVAIEERNQRCFGVWGTVGSTGRWPEVVNLWELDGWDGLAANFDHELSHPSLQDPSLAEWWSVAGTLRRGGVDRIVVPEPWTRTIDELTAAGVRGAVYAHELITVAPGGAPALLAAVQDQGCKAMGAAGLELVGAFRVAMGSDTEAIVIWAVPDWPTWVRLERAWLGEPPLSGASGGSGEDAAVVAGVGAWRDAPIGRGAVVQRSLLMDVPLAPLRLGRQPEVGDRRPLDEL